MRDKRASFVFGRRHRPRHNRFAIHGLALHIAVPLLPAWAATADCDYPAPQPPSSFDNQPLIDQDAMKNGSVSLSGGKILTLPSCTYYITGDFVMTGYSSLVVTGPVKLYVSGEVKIVGGITVNSGVPADFELIALNNSPGSDGSVDLGGGSDMAMHLYAPLSDVTIHGTSEDFDLYGSLVGKTLRIMGESAVHFDGTGLANCGNLLFYGRDNVFGPVTNNAGGKITISGPSRVTFHDQVTLNAGGEFSVGEGGAATFMSGVTGQNTLIGSGVKYFEGGSSMLGSLISPGLSIVRAPATLEAGVIRESALTVEGRVKLTDPSAVSVLESLSVGVDGQLDLGESPLIVRSDSASVPALLSELTALIASARNGGLLWSGPGITSSAAGELTGLVIALNRSSAGAPLHDDFHGEGVGPDDILIMNSWNGDANLDGVVDGADYLAIDRGFLTRAAGYAGGDFDYSGQVNGDDFFLIDRSFLGQHTASSPAASPTAVPEPGTLLGLAGLSLLGLRRRRR